MRLQSAIFDMDGTLLDSMGMWWDLGAGFLRERGIEPRPDFRAELRIRAMSDAAEYIRTTYGLKETAKEIAEELTRRAERFYLHEVRPKAGAEEFLRYLKMEGVWMYVATGTDRSLARGALEHTGLDRFFRGMVTCEEAGGVKSESPLVYEHCLTRLQSNKKDTVVFEDALSALRTAKAAGFRTAAVYDPYAEGEQEALRAEADYYIRSYREFFDSGALD